MKQIFTAQKKRNHQSLEGGTNKSGAPQSQDINDFSVLYMEFEISYNKKTTFATKTLYSCMVF